MTRTIPIGCRTSASLLFALICSSATVPLSAQEPATLQAGAVAPDFTSNDLAGREVRLADYRGKVVVLDFWATWCGPCKQSLPHMQSIAKAHATHDVVVLAVCTSDSRAKFETWVKANQEQYPDVVFTCDPRDRESDAFDDRASQKLYHVQGLPTKFVIGKDGRIVLTMVGYDEGDQRLEAGLLRAGIDIDAAIAKTGEAQILEQAKEDAVRAAEAAANPPPPFWPMFGSIKAGEAMPDFTLLGPDGKEFTLSSLRGKPCILAFAWAEIVPKKQLQELVERYAPYDVQVVATIVNTSPEEYTQWLGKNQAGCSFHIGRDPAGKFVPSSENASAAEREAFSAKTVVKRYFHGNMTPAMPALVACDAAGHLLGAFSLNRRDEAIANLLLHAGVELKPEHMPKVVAAADAFVAPAPRAPESRVPMREVGTMAPDFTMQDVDGKDIKLSAYRGKIVVLDFWATWCGPCKASMPHTDHVAEHFEQQGVVVIAACTSDERKAFESWVRLHQQDFPHMVFAHDAAERSAERASRRLYGVGGIPQQFVIDRDGKIVASVDGYLQGEVLLEAALAKAGVPIDAALLEQAAADQKKRDANRKPSAPAMKMK